jgi:phenylpyruvate tautomerase PptA (4-oxalocrotonate tautomerase family)
MKNGEVKGTIEFVRDAERQTTSVVIDGVEMGSWIGKHEPSWVKKVRELIEQRALLAGN